MKYIDKESSISELKNGGIIEFDNKTLVLASNSITRKRILENNNIHHVTIPSLADEEGAKKRFGKVDTLSRAEEYVKKLSYEKAWWLKDRLKNAIILTADTVAFYKDRILEKPKDEADARRIFNFLSDTTHYAITGVCIVDDDKINNFSVVSPIKLLTITQEEQDILVKNPMTYKYAGGYCIDDNFAGKAIVAEEDFNNVMGLPLREILEYLKEAMYDFSE